MIDLRLDNVSKRYRVYQEDPTHHEGLFRKILSKLGRGKEFWALSKINLQVKRGETLGILGRNGSGKSTILKLLSKVTAPTEGLITVRGRVAALLEVSSGFHPDLTGRENIFLNGSIIGIRRREIHAELDRIMDFAEVRPFIDVPVKRYSSGMLVRLGFSIAAHVRTDILLLDEVLAVGDIAFQRKCIEHILRLKERGVTIIFISHDLAAVERICDRAVLLERGQIVREGLPRTLAGEYLTRVDGLADNDPPTANQPVRIQGVQFSNEAGIPSLQFNTGDPLRARLEYASLGEGPVVLRLCFFGIDDKLRCEFVCGPETLPAGRGAIEFTCEAIGLLPGIYQIEARTESSNGAGLDVKQRCAVIHVGSGKVTHGAFYTPHAWRIESSLPFD